MQDRSLTCFVGVRELMLQSDWFHDSPLLLTLPSDCFQDSPILLMLQSDWFHDLNLLLVASRFIRIWSDVICFEICFSYRIIDFYLQLPVCSFGVRSLGFLLSQAVKTEQPVDTQVLTTHIKVSSGAAHWTLVLTFINCHPSCMGNTSIHFSSSFGTIVLGTFFSEKIKSGYLGSVFKRFQRAFTFWCHPFQNSCEHW